MYTYGPNNPINGKDPDGNVWYNINGIIQWLDGSGKQPLQGYFNGVFPPGKRDPTLAGYVMKNLLNAHVRVYRHLKTLQNGDDVQIGLVKNITQFDPLRRWHVLDWYLSQKLNEVSLSVHDCA